MSQNYNTWGGKNNSWGNRNKKNNQSSRSNNQSPNKLFGVFVGGVIAIAVANSVFGAIVSLIGFSRLMRKIEYFKRVFLNFGFFILFIALLFALDFVNVMTNEVPPRFSTVITTGDKNIIYETPLYNVYRINRTPTTF